MSRPRVWCWVGCCRASARHAGWGAAARSPLRSSPVPRPSRPRPASAWAFSSTGTSRPPSAASSRAPRVTDLAGGPGAIDVLGIGNALVDVLSHASDALIADRGLVKGTMCLIDEADARELYDAMGPGVQISGGSAANTIVGVASFGARAHYVGTVRNDQLGEVFAHDLRS